MTQTLSFLSFAAIVLLLGMAACNESKSANPATKNKKDAAATQAAKIKRGEYLLTVAGCDDCHSPKKLGAHGPEIDMEHRLSGYPQERPFPKYDPNSLKNGWVSLNMDLTAAVGPWGASFAANLTSDSTGIGMWKEEQFFRSMREGKAKGLENNRVLLPPMPWQNLSHFSDEDLSAIFAYLQTTKPVKNVVPQPIPLDKLVH